MNAHRYQSNGASRDPACAICGREQYDHRSIAEGYRLTGIRRHFAIVLAPDGKRCGWVSRENFDTPWKSYPEHRGGKPRAGCGKHRLRSEAVAALVDIDKSTAHREEPAR